MSVPVAIVVDRAFGDSIRELARERHVWVIESPTNTPVIRDIWRNTSTSADADPLGPGVTSFSAPEEEAAPAACLRILETVNDHHGDDQGGSGWSEIEVVGTHLDAALRVALVDLGVTEFQEKRTGFVCRR